MLTLGFTNHYYTLWSVINTIRHGAGMTINGVFTGEVYDVTKFTYIQNLSMNYEEAKNKITAIAGENGYNEDLDLRGDKGSFERTVRQINAMADWQFSFGKITGQDMRISDDIWQLKRAMNSEPSLRRRVVARRRLIDLGELVRYDWVDRSFKQELCDQYWRDNGGVITNENNPTHDMFCVPVTRKYATPKQVEISEAKKLEATLSGHFFEDKKRISIKVKRIGGFSFDTAYGTTFVEKYLTEDGKIVKYMGGNPPEISQTEFVEITGTVKHDNYKGQDETKLQRIKVSVLA